MTDLNKFLATVSTIESIVLVAAIVSGGYLWARGIFPALLRLGNGLSRRNIALFAKGDNATSLKHLLTDSKLFRAKNITEITGLNDIGRAESASVYLVHWHDWANDIDAVLNQKPDGCVLVVYAPYNMGRIPDDQMRNLDGQRNTSVTNFRGRLLNDIVTSMITTGYK